MVCLDGRRCSHLQLSRSAGGACPRESSCFFTGRVYKRSQVPDTKKLVIVESPTKVKSIAQYLGEGYEVMASVGHIRDLIEPKNLPPELKKGSLGKFSVDVENDFEPYYVVSDQKKKTVA